MMYKIKKKYFLVKNNIFNWIFDIKKIAIFLIGVTFGQVSFGQPPSEFCPGLNSQNCPDDYISDIFFINLSSLDPALAGCETPIIVWYKLCKNKVVVGGWDFFSPELGVGNIYLDSEQCKDALINYFNKLSRPFSTIDQLDELYLNVMFLLGEQLGAGLASNIINSDNIASFTCGKGPHLVTVEFTVAGCGSFCQGFTKEEKPKMVLQKGSCGYSCCYVQYFYCVQPGSSPNKIKLKLNSIATVNQSNLPCTSPSTDGPCTDPNVNWRSKSCTPICEKIDDNMLSKVVSNSSIKEYSLNESLLKPDVDSNISYNSELIIYPNPTNNLLNITFPQLFEGKVNIYNLLGEEILSQKVNKEKIINISTSEYANGTYIVHFISASGIKTTKNFNVSHH